MLAFLFIAVLAQNGGFGTGFNDAVTLSWNIFRLGLIVAFAVYMYRRWRNDQADVFTGMLKLVAAAVVALWLTSSPGVDFLLGLFQVGSQEIEDRTDGTLFTFHTPVELPSVDLTPHLATATERARLEAERIERERRAAESQRLGAAHAKAAKSMNDADQQQNQPDPIG